MVENRSRRAPAPRARANMRATTEGAEIPRSRSANRLRRCAIARRHACRLCAATGTVAPPLLDGRKSVAPRARANMRATTEGAEIPRSRSANRLRRCAIARRHACRLCAATGTVAPTLLDGRKSVAPLAHTNMRATTEGAEILRSGNSLRRRAIALGYSPRPCSGSLKHRRPRLSMVENRSQNRSRRASAPICMQRPRGPKSLGPVNACPVAPSLSATLADRAPARASTADPVHRWSKIGRVARPHQYACNDRGGPKSLGPVTACAVAPSLSATLPNRARHPVHSRRRFSMLENLSHRPPAPICVQASV
jgi:hypothetical protein